MIKDCYNKGMMIIRYAFVMFLAVSALMSPVSISSAVAADDFSLRIELFRLWARENPEYKLPIDAVIEDEVKFYKGPISPKVPKVEFYQYDKPQHVQGRVESLVHGLTITLPSEYDHYGYEIRRYMNQVGRIGILSNRYEMEAELVNIEKAWIVFGYWRELLLEELDNLDRAIKKDTTVSAKVKTLFKVNEAIVKAFVIETQSWINTNDDLLKFLADNRKDYTFEQGVFLFKEKEPAQRFIGLFSARERAKRQMRKYDPFGAIVY